MIRFGHNASLDKSDHLADDRLVGDADAVTKTELSNVRFRQPRFQAGCPCTHGVMSDSSNKHRSRLNAWQRLAFAWCQQHPDRLLMLVGKHRSWDVYRRGEYVEFRLPYHDMGGERSYISRDGYWKIHVDED